MKWAATVLLLASCAFSQEAPFYPRSTKSNQDLGGINQNFLDLGNRNVCNLTQRVTPASCGPSQALVGACYNRGSVIGGACMTISASSITITSTAAYAQTAPWSGLQGFPSACSSGQYVSAVGASLTCSVPYTLPGDVAFTDRANTFTSSQTVAGYDGLRVSGDNGSASANIALGGGFGTGYVSFGSYPSATESTLSLAAVSAVGLPPMLQLAVYPADFSSSNEIDITTGGVTFANGNIHLSNGHIFARAGNDPSDPDGLIALINTKQVQWIVGSQNTSGDFFVQVKKPDPGAGYALYIDSISLAVSVGSSMTASAFFGDGSNLTGISSSGGVSTTTLATSTAAIWTQLGQVATDTASIRSQANAIGTATGTLASLPNTNTFASSQTITAAAGLLVSGGSVTAGAFFGDGANIANLSTASLPGWSKYTIGFSSFSSTYSTATWTLLSLGAKSIIHAVVVKPQTSFGGGGITAATVSVGISSNLVKYSDSYDVFQSTASNTAQLTRSAMNMEDFVSATNILSYLTGTGDTLNHLTKGSVDIWVEVSTLP